MYSRVWSSAANPALKCCTMICMISCASLAKISCTRARNVWGRGWSLPSVDPWFAIFETSAPCAVLLVLINQMIVIKCLLLNNHYHLVLPMFIDQPNDSDPRQMIVIHVCLVVPCRRPLRASWHLTRDGSGADFLRQLLVSGLNRPCLGIYVTIGFIHLYQIHN